MKTYTLNNKSIKYFDDNAEKLSEFYNEFDRSLVHKDIINLISKKENMNILDIGSGSGADADLFASMGHNIFAVEPSKKMLSLAIKRFKNNKIKWISDNLPELNRVILSKSKFDLIYSIGVLQYLDKEDRLMALNKIISLIDVGGFIEIQYPVPPSREYQSLIPDDEIKDFVAAIKGLEICVEEKSKELNGRKALDGSDLYINLIIIRKLSSYYLSY